MNRREFLQRLRIGGYLAVARVLLAFGAVWRVRYLASRLAYVLPAALERGPLELHEAPEVEYAATWTVDPPTAREEFRDTHGFSGFFWSQMQAYDRNGSTVFERGNLVYWPDGKTGRPQIHIRLFPTEDGYTEVWAHWELNIFTHRDAHSDGEALDPERGEQYVRELLDEEQLIRTEESSKTGPPQ